MPEFDALGEKILGACRVAFEVEARDKIRCFFVRGYSFRTKLYGKVLNVVQIIIKMAKEW